MALTAILANGWTATDDRSPPPTFAPETSPELLAVTRSLAYDDTGGAISIVDWLELVQRTRQVYPNQTQKTANSVALRDVFLTGDTASGIGTNSSTLVSPTPIGNWALADRLVVGNSIGGSAVPVEVIAGHYFARRGRQVACARFTITDGTTSIVVNVSTTQPSIRASATGGGAIVVYALPLTDITSLAAGLIKIDCKLFPFVGGAASVLDSAVGALRAGFSTRWYRKDVSRAASPPLAYVRTGGSDATGSWATTAAGADASPFATVQGAWVATTNATRGTPFTGGYLDGATVKCGVPQISDGLGGGGSFVLPANGTAQSLQQIARVTVEAHSSAELTFGAGLLRPYLSGALASGVTTQALCLKGPVKRTGASGMLGEASAKLDCDWEDVVLNPNGFTGVTLGGNGNLRVVGLTATAVLNGTFAASASGTVLLRAADIDLADNACDNQLVLGNRLKRVDGLDGVYAVAVNNSIIFGNRLENPAPSNRPAISYGAAANASNCFVAQNVIELVRIGTGPMLKINADAAAGSVNHLVCHQNTFTGAWIAGRSNTCYDENGTPRTSLWISFVGNIHVQVNTKSDIFMSDGTRVGNWWYEYGVGTAYEFSQYIDANNGGSDSFRQMYPGLGSTIGTSNSVRLDPKFTGYAGLTYNGSTYTAGAGGGDYNLASDSPCLGANKRAVLSHGFAGNARGLTTTAQGAYAGPSGETSVVALAPAAASLVFAAATLTLAARANLAFAVATLLVAAGTPTLTARADLAPAVATLLVAAGTPTLTARADLAPATGAIAFLAAATALTSSAGGGGGGGGSTSVPRPPTARVVIAPAR